MANLLSIKTANSRTTDLVKTLAPIPGTAQELFFKTPARDIFYGGARGGGKTFCILLHFLRFSVENKSKAIGLIIRRESTQFFSLIKEAQEMYDGVANYNSTRSTFTFHNGAVLRLGHMKLDTDVSNYQGQEYSWICIEEAGNFPRPEPLDLLRACLRSAAGVKTYYIVTGNPFGAGHRWLKERYVDPVEPYTIQKIKTSITVNNKIIVSEITRVFIKATLKDNPILLEKDPNYLQSLMEATKGNPLMRKGWMEGDWEGEAEGMFSLTWNRKKHVIGRFKVPVGWVVFRSFDWGYSSPFSVGWWGKSDGTPISIYNSDGNVKVLHLPKGSMVRIFEWYGSDNEGRGLKMLEKDFVKGVIERDQIVKELYGVYDIRDGVADSAIFSEQDGTSIADKHANMDNPIYWERCTKFSGSRISGWQLLNDYLHNGLTTTSVYEKAVVLVTVDCRDFIRIVPTISFDPKNLDDITGEDHICDETVYALRHQIYTGSDVMFSNPFAMEAQ